MPNITVTGLDNFRKKFYRTGPKRPKKDKFGCFVDVFASIRRERGVSVFFAENSVLCGIRFTSYDHLKIILKRGR